MALLRRSACLVSKLSALEWQEQAAQTARNADAASRKQGEPLCRGPFAAHRVRRLWMRGGGFFVADIEKLKALAEAARTDNAIYGDPNDWQPSFGLSPAEQAFAEEIGRASCRERV